jgi:hypothetical protein
MVALGTSHFMKDDERSQCCGSACFGDMDPDLDPTFQLDADPDLDPILRFTHV